VAIARSRVHPIPGESVVWSVVSMAWTLAIALPILGHGDMVSHHELLEGHMLPPLPTLLLFLAAWQVMTGAMMLPSSLPMVGLFARSSRGQVRPRLALVAFLAAYFAVWTGFALLALIGDAGLHQVVERWHWLDERPRLITGSVLVLAGGFQFSPLKERCLNACRNPVAFLWHHYRRGLWPAWALGLRHGVFCLGCCWALMLVMFAVGVGSLAWMAALTGVMMIEKTARWGRRLIQLVGSALLIWGAIVLLQPSLFPMP